MEPQITCHSESSAELWWMDQNPGIPLHVWNLESFLQIGDACGGYIDVARKTREQSDLIEASIRIKDNYSGFILAFIKLFDKKGRVTLFNLLLKQKGDGIWKEIQASTVLLPEKR